MAYGKLHESLYNPRFFCKKEISYENKKEFRVAKIFFISDIYFFMDSFTANTRQPIKELKERIIHT